MQLCLLLLADSRGRSLAPELEKNLPSGSVVLEVVIPGAKSDRLYDRLKSFRSTLRNRYASYKIAVVLLGGICDLTTKCRGRHQEEIYYLPRQASVEVFKSSFSNIVDYCKGEGWYLIPTTILPVGLKANTQFAISQGKLTSSSFSEAQTKQQQQSLETDVAALNEYITKKSCDEGLTLCELHATIQVTTVKHTGKNKTGRKIHTRFDYNRLVDGVHPTEQLKEKFIGKILESVGPLTPVAAERKDPETETETEEDSEKEIYNFKRRKIEGQAH